MSTTTRFERFLTISRLLLEVDDVNAATAAIYLRMLDDLDPDWPLDAMAADLARFTPLELDEREPLIVTQLRSQPAWHDAAAAVLEVWYSGSLSRPSGDPVPQQPGAYLGALMWPLLKTQPSGLPGTFFGEWAYPPTRADTSLDRAGIETSAVTINGRGR